MPRKYVRLNADIRTITERINELIGEQTSVDTTANFASVSASINTLDKYQGKMAFNSTTSKPVWAAGANANSIWVDATGATAHTPV